MLIKTGKDQKTGVNTKLLTRLLASANAFLLTVALLMDWFKEDPKEPFISEPKYETFDDFVERNAYERYLLKPGHQEKEEQLIQHMRYDTE